MKNLMDAIKMKVTDPIDFDSLRLALHSDAEQLKKTLVYMKEEGIIGIDAFGRITLK